MPPHGSRPISGRVFMPIPSLRSAAYLLRFADAAADGINEISRRLLRHVISRGGIYARLVDSRLPIARRDMVTRRDFCPAARSTSPHAESAIRRAASRRKRSPGADTPCFLMRWAITPLGLCAAMTISRAHLRI